ncbi:MAG: hypothetical protein ACI4W2_07045 [Eubacterium sp.]|jgi:uncharacterized coiled-coil protein SlyX
MKNKKSGKTITEIANEIGIDRQKVYRYVVNHLISDELGDESNDEVINHRRKTIYCDKATERAIIQHFNSSNSDSLSDESDELSDESSDQVINKVINPVMNKVFNSDHAGEEDDRKLNSQISEKKDELVKELRNRIKSQEKIITHQQRTIDELSESLKRAQTLQAAAEKRYLEIETQVTKSSKMSMQEEPKSEEKHGFFWRLFH